MHLKSIYTSSFIKSVSLGNEFIYICFNDTFLKRLDVFVDFIIYGVVINT